MPRITIDEVKRHSLKLSWLASSIPSSTYILELRFAESQTWERHPVDQPRFTLPVSDFSRVYLFRVADVSPGGVQGPWSEEVSSYSGSPKIATPFIRIAGTDPMVDYNANARRCLAELQRFNSTDPALDLVTQLRPVHRLSAHTLNLAVRSGGLRALTEVRGFQTKDPSDALKVLLEQSAELRGLLADLGLPQSTQELWREGLHTLAKAVHEGTPIEQWRELLVRPPCQEMLRSLEALPMFARYEQTPPVFAEETLLPLIRRTVDYLKGLETGVPGKHVAADGEMGTNGFVFTTLGKNNGVSYGGIRVILNGRILHHPDTWITVNAATSIRSTRTVHFRPYTLEEYKAQPREVLAHCSSCTSIESCQCAQSASFPSFKATPVDIRLRQHRLHMAHPLTAKVLATELHHQVVTDLIRRGDRRPPSDISVDPAEIKSFFLKHNPHGCIEAHLPAFVPVDFFNSIIIPESALTPELEATLKTNRCRMYSESPLWDIVRVVRDAEEADRVEQEAFCREEGDCFSSSTGSGQNVVQRPDFKCKGFWFVLQNLKQKEVFLPLRFSTPGQGSVSCYFKGQHLAFFFTVDPHPTRNTDREVYMICIGMNRGSFSYIRKCNKKGEPVLVGKRDEVPQFQKTFGPLWISILNGDIAVGRGTSFSAEEVFMSYRDSSPLQFTHLAVSNYESSVELRDLVLQDAPKSAAHTS